ncbi:MAG TPA: GIY-YIG nuclease family protein [Thermomicrobiales bacterium]|nr:GIY-YIG nuclease family protein [Thermomicrobiales bacterium]
MREYFVYIAASPSRTIYIGVTNNLERRMYEHKRKLFKGFTAKYGVDRLVHMEEFANIDDAIAREKELKGWRRARKVALIEEENPRWYDLSHSWFQ